MECLRQRWLAVSIGGVIVFGTAGPGGIWALPAVAHQDSGVVIEVNDPVDRRLADILGAHSAEKGRLEARVRAAHEKLLAETVDRLQTLQDEHCRAARLDEALAVREQIRRLRRETAAVDVAASQPAFVAPPPPDSLSRLHAEVGSSHRFTVTGSTRGTAWGTDVYTLDSNLAVAAVHAGALAVGETGVVKVTIFDSQAEHVGSLRHGITTHTWPRYRMSFRVERVGAVPAVDAPGGALPAAAVRTGARALPEAQPVVPAPPTLPAIPLEPAIQPAPGRPSSPSERAPPPAAVEPSPPAEPRAAKAEPSAPAPIDRAAPRRPFD